MDHRLRDSILRSVETLAVLEELLNAREAFLFTDNAIRDLRVRATNAGAASTALRQAIESGRGSEAELNRALATVDAANGLLKRVEAIDEALASVGVETSPGAGEGDAPRQADEPAGRREQLAQGGGGQHFAGPAPGEREASEWRLRGRGAGDRAAAQEPEAQDQEMGDGEGAAESGAVPQMEGVSVGEAAAIRARTARIRAELAEILESQGGALVFTGGAAGGGLRIGVRPGGFNTAGAGGRGFARAAATGEGGARPLHETFHHGRGVNRDPITGRSGRGRGFTSAREAVQRAPGPIDPRERAARMFAELDVIFAGSTPAGRRSNRSRRRVFETTLEDYGFVVERVGRTGGRAAVDVAGPSDRGRPQVGRRRAARRLGPAAGAAAETTPPVGQQASRGEGRTGAGFVRAADVLTEPRDRVGRISSLVPSATAGDENGGVGNEESDRGGEGGGGGGSGGGGGQEGVEGESEGLKLYKWEHNVFSIASSRPQADLSGFRYTEESEVSGEGCGKETCTIAPRTGGEVGACYCPVPVGVEDSDLQLNPVCQCDPQLRSPGQECRFSVADRDLPPVKKLLVLGVGVVAGEDTPEGSLVAVCKGQVMSEWEARPKLNLADHVSNIIFVGNDRGRVWAYDETEVGSVFRMVEHVLDESNSNVVALRICGDRTRAWGDNCPPRVALFTSEDVDAGFRFRWAKRESGFDGFDSSSSQSEGVESQFGEEEEDASGDSDDVSGTDVAMTDANMDG